MFITVVFSQKGKIFSIEVIKTIKN